MIMKRPLPLLAAIFPIFLVAVTAGCEPEPKPLTGAIAKTRIAFTETAFYGLWIANADGTELKKIAEICEWVPANPARTFHEALQCVWFTNAFSRLEQIMAGQMGLGRIDQYLYPYFNPNPYAYRNTHTDPDSNIYSHTCSHRYT